MSDEFRPGFFEVLVDLGRYPVEVRVSFENAAHWGVAYQWCLTTFGRKSFTKLPQATWKNERVSEWEIHTDATWSARRHQYNKNAAHFYFASKDDSDRFCEQFEVLSPRVWIALSLIPLLKGE